ncbi:MAG: cytochrome C [Thermoanaerobaculia bacterium]|nr:MAG: cytochrome C [Thermoanaerobaculia bacterium]
MRAEFRDSEHLVRMALLFGVGVLLFLGLRAVLVPADFGELGHFRTGALDDNRRPALVHAGRAACAECHDTAAKLKTGAHARVGCESCHGALAAHAADPDAAAPPQLEVVALCVRCHGANPARPSSHPQVEPEAHAEGAACTDCHEPHAPAA